MYKTIANYSLVYVLQNKIKPIVNVCVVLNFFSNFFVFFYFFFSVFTWTWLLTCGATGYLKPFFQCSDGAIKIRVGCRKHTTQQAVQEDVRLLVGEFLQARAFHEPHTTWRVFRQQKFVDERGLTVYFR